MVCKMSNNAKKWKARFTYFAMSPRQKAACRKAIADGEWNTATWKAAGFPFEAFLQYAQVPKEQADENFKRFSTSFKQCDLESGVYGFQSVVFKQERKVK